MKTLLVVLTTLLPSLAIAWHGWELRLTDSDGHIKMIAYSEDFESCRQSREELLGMLEMTNPDETWYITCSPETEEEVIQL